MAFEPSKGYQALRRGRFSEAGALYFLTFCTAGRNMGLTEVTIAHAVQQEWRAMSLGGVWILRCGTVMPDHVHLLVELGANSPCPGPSRDSRPARRHLCGKPGCRGKPATMTTGSGRRRISCHIFSTPT
jgi:hypothetical protein